jgi:hypothetical protein
MAVAMIRRFQFQNKSCDFAKTAKFTANKFAARKSVGLRRRMQVALHRIRRRRPTLFLAANLFALIPHQPSRSLHHYFPAPLSLFLVRDVLSGARYIGKFAARSSDSLKMLHTSDAISNFELGVSES